MSHRQSRFIFLIASAVTLTPAWATYVNVADCPYCQTFATLAQTGTATWQNDMSGASGWFIQSTVANLSGNGSGLTYMAGSGTSSSVGIYSFGNSSDRSLGAITGANAVAFGNLLLNNTGNTITSLTVSYTGDQWRSASTSAQSLLFSYAVAAGTVGKFYDVDGVGAKAYLSPTVVSGSDSTGDNKGLTWNSVSAGTFTSPNLTGSGAVTATTSLSFTLTGLNIPNGSAIMMRWLDQANNTDGLAIDNVCVSIPAAAPVPEASTYAAIAAVVGMAGATAIRRKKKSANA
jgi:hypothetical protein